MIVGIMATDLPHLSIRDICQKTRAWGGGMVEIVLGKNVWVDRIDEAKAALAEYGLECAVCNVLDLNASGAALEDSRRIFRETIAMCQELGSRTAVTYCHAEDEAGAAAYARELAPFAKQCADLGVGIAIENEPFGITQTADGMLRVLEIVDQPNVGTNYDPDNYYNACEEGFPYAYDVLKGRITHVHAKDSKKYRDDLYGDELTLERGITAMCVPLGQGAVNWEALTRRLKEDAYNGYIAVEPHMKPERLEECYAKGISYLKAHWDGGSTP